MKTAIKKPIKRPLNRLATRTAVNEQHTNLYITKSRLCQGWFSKMLIQTATEMIRKGYYAKAKYFWSIATND